LEPAENLPVSPFEAMKAAMELVPTSEHPQNKIAACVFGQDPGGADYMVPAVNHWPEAIKERIGTNIKIGNASGTVHAETAAILGAPYTFGASICISDPFCPNCAKNMAEAGIRRIFIDHEGFDRDFFERRGDHFDTMSMQICEKAGISVYELRREEQKLVPILEAPENFEAPEDSPLYQEPLEKPGDAVFRDIIEKETGHHHRRKICIAFARDSENRLFTLTARAHAAIGYSLEGADIDQALELLSPIGKYSFIQEPVNRMLMQLRRKGMRLENGYIYCSQVPTSREQVNLVAAGIDRITIGDIQKCRDPDGLKAMEQLSLADILRYV